MDCRAYSYDSYYFPHLYNMRGKCKKSLLLCSSLYTSYWKLFILSNRSCVAIFWGIQAMPVLPFYLLKEPAGIALLHLYPLKPAGTAASRNWPGFSKTAWVATCYKIQSENKSYVGTIISAYYLSYCHIHRFSKLGKMLFRSIKFNKKGVYIFIGKMEM